MIKFNQFLTERFINLVGADKLKSQYAKEVFEMIQTAYSEIGGIKGSGFNSPDDMIKNIWFWKLIRKNNKIVTVVLYKDKGGRKLVCVATDGSPEGKKGLSEILESDLKQTRAYMEVSCTLLSFMVRVLGYSEIIKHAKTVEEVSKILITDKIFPANPLDHNVIKHKPLEPFFYQREIGGEMNVKIMLGHVGK